MSKRLIFVIAAGLSLGGCCLGTGCYVQPATNARLSWYGYGPFPDRFAAVSKRHPVKRANVRKTNEALASDDGSPNEEDLAKLRPYSKEWGAALEAMNRAADARLRRKLIICRGCMPPEPDDQTGSIASPK
jgi:hypothetical protein